jgi:hypothetical protein
MTPMATATAMAMDTASPVAANATVALSTKGLLGSALLVAATLYLAILSLRCSLSWDAASDSVLRYTAADGFLRERLARAQYFAGARPGIPGLPDTISARSAFLAGRAFRQEPFAVDALTLLGIQLASTGDQARARKVIEAAGGLSRRSTLTSFWLIKDDVGRGDIAEALQQYDDLLRAQPELQPPLLQALVAAVQDRTNLPLLGAVLAKRPPWSEDFWAMLAASPQSLNNSGALRASLVSAFPYDRRRDEPLFAALVRAGLYADAEALYAKIIPPGRTQSGNLLRNGRFKHSPAGAPLDWQTYSTGEFGAKIRPEAGDLAVYSVGDSGGIVARQMVRLTADSYRLSALAAGDADADNSLSIRLSCQQPGEKSRANLSWSLHAGRNTRTLEIPTGCQFYFLDIAVGGSSSMKGSAATVTDVSMQKI